MNEKLKGYSLVIGSYIMWGVLPIYWNMLSTMSPFLVLFHRVLWSMLLLLIVLLSRGALVETLTLLRDRSLRRGIFASSIFLGVNWLTYIWAMGAGEFVAASMGYFLCPILTIALGAIFCKESLSPGRQIAVLVLLAGIAIPVVMQGQIPWIALVLAGSWSGYTLIRKRMTVGALQGVFLETLVLAVPLGAVALGVLGPDGSVGYEFGLIGMLLLIGAGIVTAVPQIALISGARLIPLSVVGVTQYLAPTIMLAISAMHFGEMPTRSEYISISLFWLGITLFFAGDKLLSFCNLILARVFGTIQRYCFPGRSVVRYLNVEKNIPEKDAA